MPGYGNPKLIPFPPAMLPQIETLLVLQDRDKALRELRHDLERIPAEVARAHTRLQDVEAAFDKAHHALQETDLAIRKLEMDVKTRRDTIARLGIQQFETRKNEEYTAFGVEIENYKKQVNDLEDKELELMEQAESRKATLANAQAAVDATRKAVADEVAAYAQREAGDRARLVELEADRARLAALVDPDALALYERLLPRKFPPVVTVDHGETCGGCHMKLTTGTAAEVKSGRRLTHCDQCGRLIYAE